MTDDSTSKVSFDSALYESKQLKEGLKLELDSVNCQRPQNLVLSMLVQRSFSPFVIFSWNINL